MTKVLLAAMTVLLLFLGVQTWRLYTVQAEAVKLRSTVQSLAGTLDRNSRATAAYRKALVVAQAKAIASAAALERALAASPEWSAGSVPLEVQNAP